MKWKCAAAVLSLALLGYVQAGAANQWDMALVGQMTAPAHVSFEAGEQQAVPFAASRGPKWFFTRKGMPGGYFYTMTYADGPDFSYGWAISAILGSQYMLEAGIPGYQGRTPGEQMDLIAEHLNRTLKEKGVSYKGSAPLVRIGGKKNPRWEGSFVETRKEKDITYREAYQVVLQVSGFQTVIGIVNSDANRPDLAAALHKMMARRKFYSDKDMLRRFLEQR